MNELHDRDEVRALIERTLRDAPPPPSFDAIVSEAATPMRPVGGRGRPLLVAAAIVALMGIGTITLTLAGHQRTTTTSAMTAPPAPLSPSFVPADLRPVQATASLGVPPATTIQRFVVSRDRQQQLTFVMVGLPVSAPVPATTPSEAPDSTLDVAAMTWDAASSTLRPPSSGGSYQFVVQGMDEATARAAAATLAWRSARRAAGVAPTAGSPLELDAEVLPETAGSRSQQTVQVWRAEGSPRSLRISSSTVAGADPALRRDAIGPRTIRAGREVALSSTRDVSFVDGEQLVSVSAQQLSDDELDRVLTSLVPLGERGWRDLQATAQAHLAAGPLVAATPEALAPALGGLIVELRTDPTAPRAAQQPVLCAHPVGDQASCASAAAGSDRSASGAGGTGQVRLGVVSIGDEAWLIGTRGSEAPDTTLTVSIGSTEIVVPTVRDQDGQGWMAARLDVDGRRPISAVSYRDVQPDGSGGAGLLEIPL